MTMQTIKTIDLGLCKNTKEVHEVFEKTLGFPNFYGRNWDAMWDAITGLVDMPTNLILYNYLHFDRISKPDADKLIQLTVDYNEKFKGTSIIQLDYLDGLEKGRIETLFKRRPFQYGFRGDIHLWDNLETSLIGESIPDNEQKLVDQIRGKIFELTGGSTLNKKDFYVKTYDSGGMSGGGISWEFWEKRGIPLLIGRYRVLKKME